MLNKYCYNIITMYIDDQTYKRNGNKYRRVLVREKVKIKKGKYKTKTLLNLSDYNDEFIESFKFLLKNEKNPDLLKKLIKSNNTKSGKPIGDIYVLTKLLKRLNIKKALGNSRNAKLILWLIITRLIFQGSRLSAVRDANTRPVAEILHLDKFNEDDLYNAMEWLSNRQEKIEKELYKKKTKEEISDIFLYDISSSYFEGDKNELAAYGYNRDKKKGKKQVVFGLLTDKNGDPISIQIFKGNTSDNQTLEEQILKLKERFNCKNITIVGDKGMIKRTNISNFNKIKKEKNINKLKYITTISKRKIKSLKKKGVIQLSLFEEKLNEVIDTKNNIRYILRKNPVRAENMKENRDDKIKHIYKKQKKSNKYLLEHPRAKVEVQKKRMTKKIKKLRLKKIITVIADEENRKIKLKFNKKAYEKEVSLDGCYVVKTNLTSKSIDKKIIHQRYKQLSKVEKAFRVSKKEHLKVRPIFVRKKTTTKAHFFIQMLAYKVAIYLRKKWADLNITVKEGIDRLGNLTTNIVEYKKDKIQKIPTPNKRIKKILNKLDINIPKVIPYKNIEFLTRKKLPEDR